MKQHGLRIVIRMMRGCDHAVRCCAPQGFIPQLPRSGFEGKTAGSGIFRHADMHCLKRDTPFFAQLRAECSVAVRLSAADAVMNMYGSERNAECFPQIMQTAQQRGAVRTA